MFIYLTIYYKLLLKKIFDVNINIDIQVHLFSLHQEKILKEIDEIKQILAQDTKNLYDAKYRAAVDIIIQQKELSDVGTKVALLVQANTLLSEAYRGLELQIGSFEQRKANLTAFELEIVRSILPLMSHVMVTKLAVHRLIQVLSQSPLNLDFASESLNKTHSLLKEWLDVFDNFLQERYFVCAQSPGNNPCNYVMISLFEGNRELIKIQFDIDLTSAYGYKEALRINQIQRIKEGLRRNFPDKISLLDNERNRRISYIKSCEEQLRR